MISHIIAGLAGVALTCSAVYFYSANFDGGSWAFATGMALLLALHGLDD